MLLDTMKNRVNEVNPAATQIATFLKDMEDSMATEGCTTSVLNQYAETDDDDDFDVGVYNSQDLSPAEEEEEIDLRKLAPMSTDANKEYANDGVPYDAGDPVSNDDDDAADDEEVDGDISDILAEIEDMNEPEDPDDDIDDI